MRLHAIVNYSNYMVYFRMVLQNGSICRIYLEEVTTDHWDNHENVIQISLWRHKHTSFSFPFCLSNRQLSHIGRRHVNVSHQQLTLISSTVVPQYLIVCAE